LSPPQDPGGAESDGRRAALQHLAAADRFHARPKTVPPLADELAGLICALHDAISELPNV